ncbi:MAG: hypothetical protein NUV56_03290 [Candidatus Uhrbacteria bacterium]|nr:hypothetical protein [Candidatus Uhrbacteria bacterium]
MVAHTLPEDIDDSLAGNWSGNPRFDWAAEKGFLISCTEHVSPALFDTTPINLVAIDCQRDFTSPKGSLFVGGRSSTGAVDDMRRLSRWVFQNAPVITRIFRTRDRHRFGQIFCSEFWLDRDGVPLKINHEIIWNEGGRVLVSVIPGTNEVEAYDVRPNPMLLPWVAPDKTYQWLYAFCVHYCKSVEAKGYRLYLWVKHCVDGTIGNTLDAMFDESCAYHSALRSVPPVEAPKGDFPLSEFYGVFAPEVMVAHDGSTVAQPKQWLHDELNFGKEIYGGEAMSHCAGWSILQRVAYRKEHGMPVSDMYLLRDCTSSVVIRGASDQILVDFTPQGEKLIDELMLEGVNIVESTTPIEEWPGMEHLRAA